MCSIGWISSCLVKMGELMARSSPLSKKNAAAVLNERSNGNRSKLCLAYRGLCAHLKNLRGPQILARLSAFMVSMPS